MKILDHKTILRKVERLAYQILEQNYNANKIILLGINTSGSEFSKLILKQLSTITEITIQIGKITINTREPISDDIICSISSNELQNQHVIVLDDVANTGRTLFYACKPILDCIPHRLETGVLVDRTHKNFPIHVNYIGMSLATTLKDNIKVSFIESDLSATLE